MILVSACLYGMPCRYDGLSKGSKVLRDKLFEEPLLLACPEQLGGLPTPRPPADLSGGDGNAVLDGTGKVLRRKSNEDVTAEFIRGAERTLELTKKCGITRAILKSKSPSCGVCSHYEDGKLCDGPGVTAAILKRAGIEVRERE